MLSDESVDVYRVQVLHVHVAHLVLFSFEDVPHRCHQVIVLFLSADHLSCQVLVLEDAVVANHDWHDHNLVRDACQCLVSVQNPANGHIWLRLTRQLA